MKKIILLIFVFYPLSVFSNSWVSNINKLPSGLDVSIQGGTLLLVPNPNKISNSNIPTLVKLLCNNASAQGFNMVRVYDGAKYVNTGALKVYKRFGC